MLATGSYRSYRPFRATICRVVLSTAPRRSGQHCGPCGRLSPRRGIGGGLLGLEAANALKQLGLETHVVEFAPNLMAVQLDSDGAAMLRKKIEALGVGYRSKSTTEIATADDGLVLRFADGEPGKRTWWSSLLVFGRRTRRAAAGWLSASAAGSALTTAAGLDPDVLAIGECALWEENLWPGGTGCQMAGGRCAGG
ncbi:MAG: NAD-binding protein [Enterobacter hormaechei]